MIVKGTLKNNTIVLDISTISISISSYIKELRDDYDDSGRLLIDKENTISIPLNIFLEIYDLIIDELENNNSQIQLCDTSQSIIDRNKKNNSFYNDEKIAEVDKNNIQELLVKKHWNPERILTDEQLRNVAKLYKYSSGATFSVPGA